jgi:hypothetical protein
LWRELFRDSAFHNKLPVPTLIANQLAAADRLSWEDQHPNKATRT